MLTEVTPIFNLPIMKPYDRTKDLVEPLDMFQSWMELHGV